MIVQEVGVSASRLASSGNGNSVQMERSVISVETGWNGKKWSSEGRPTQVCSGKFSFAPLVPLHFNGGWTRNFG